MRRTVSVLLPAVLGAVGLAGCSSVDEPDAGVVASRFLALAQSDAKAACALLAPQTAQHLQDDGGSCPKGLQDAQPPRGDTVQSVTVAINSAQVVMGNQAVFLARFDHGWRVTAAGCERESSDDAIPYSCSVEGS